MTCVSNRSSAHFLPQYQTRWKQDEIVRRQPSRSSFSHAAPWIIFTRYPLWKSSPQDFLRLRVGWRVSTCVAPSGLRYTNNLVGIMLRDSDQNHTRPSVRHAVVICFHRHQTGALNTAEAHQDGVWWCWGKASQLWWWSESLEQTSFHQDITL